MQSDEAEAYYHKALDESLPKKKDQPKSTNIEIADDWLERLLKPDCAGMLII